MTKLGAKCLGVGADLGFVCFAEPFLGYFIVLWLDCQIVT
jgi:hypothetical protein